MDLRINEVMAITGYFSPTPIYNKIKNGTFPAPFKIDGWHIRWNSSQIEEWVKNRGK